MKPLLDFCAHGVNVAMDSCSRCTAEVREFKAQREAAAAVLPVRQQAAIAAMQGLLAGGSFVGANAAKAAVTIADALIAELAK